MRILKSYEEAYHEAQECISHSSGEKMKSPWKQTPDAAEHTLKYIFDKLHHNCYMLLVTDGKGEIVKLESSTTAPSFKTALTRLNKTMTGKKRKTLLKTLKSRQWRIMQCIVKPYRQSSSIEYPAFLDGLKLRNGAFILNLTDAVILRKDGTEPWHMVSSRSLGEYNFDSHLPILSVSGQKGFWDIPIPNYDDVRLVMGFDKIGQAELDWSQKKGVAVFRGGPTGCGYTTETNMRLKLATMKSDILDVGIVENKSGTLKFDPKSGLGLLDIKQPKVPFLDLITEQSKYKYIIHVDGNVAAYRLLKSMLTGSLILRVESEYTIWADDTLKDGTHYISVKDDLSDLEEKVKWCSENDLQCKKIAEHGLKFAKKVLTKVFLQKYFQKLLEGI